MMDMLFVFEMANNHQGSVERGVQIVEAAAKIRDDNQIKAAVKLQYRHLNTFIHKNADKESKYVKRFLETRLEPDEFLTIVDAIKKYGLISMVTPFDELSVQLCRKHNIDMLKVASCSANDWPLLEAVVNAGKPIVASTGGCGFREIDRLVSFIEHRTIEEFTLMHCVARYPTPPEAANLRFLCQMRDRYDQHVGYSGHEDPSDHRITQAAIACGARVLERHFGLAPLNNYSLDPAQGDKWVKEAKDALAIQGTGEKSGGEQHTLRSLARAVFASEPIKKGEMLGDRAYFAFPAQERYHIRVSEFNPNAVASKDYKTDDPIVDSKPDRIYEMRSVIHEAKGLLREARIDIGKDHGTIELSHHYGMDRFRDCGTIIINVINREYCKKIIVCLPGQRHPLHYHEKKEETFQVLYGSMVLELENEPETEIPLECGDQFLIKRGMIHGWRSAKGCVFEEVSTTHYGGDSFYRDEKIARKDLIERKTIIKQW